MTDRALVELAIGMAALTGFWLALAWLARVVWTLVVRREFWRHVDDDLRSRPYGS